METFKLHSRRFLMNSSRFFSPPPFRQVDQQGDLHVFETPTPCPVESNNRFHCRLFPSRERRRAVIVIPQWNADAMSHVSLCRTLQRLGLTAARVTLPYHELRRPPGMKRADFMVSPNLGRTLQATRQAVLEVRQLFDWLLSQGYESIGLIGSSIGSCVGYLAFAHEPRFRAGVFNHVSSYFADVVWTGLSTRFVRWSLDGHIELEDLRHCWAPISPWYHIPKMARQFRPHLLITARYDLSFLPELSEDVFRRYHRLGIPFHRADLPCGHYTTARFPFKYLDGWHICSFIRRHL